MKIDFTNHERGYELRMVGRPDEFQVIVEAMDGALTINKNARDALDFIKKTFNRLQRTRKK